MLQLCCSFKRSYLLIIIIIIKTIKIKPSSRSEMRRSKKLNRNSNIFNYGNRTSSGDELGPNVIVDHVWLSEDDVNTGVQITELKSSRSQESPAPQTEVDDYKHSHPWSYVHRSRFQENEQRLANERRNDIIRMANQTNYSINRIEDEYDNDDFNSYYGSPDNDNKNNYNETERDNVVLNHQMNCFTIIDRHNKLISENSSDEYQNVEEINFKETMPEYSWDCNDKSFDTDEMKMNDPNLDAEKRTIWIYSFKNKRLLTDDDFHLFNIPSKDTSASSSVEDNDGNKERVKSSRAATPIPPMFVPKLNISLTPTLPTVSEITEPKRHSTSNQTEKSVRVSSLKQKTVNNWFSVNENASPFIENNKSANVFDWMALSPRMKRRKFRNVNMQSKINLSTVREIERSTYAENKLRMTKEPCGNETKRTVGSQTENVETHSKKSFRTPTSFRSPRTARIDSSMDKVVEEPDIEECSPEDRGDYVKDKCIPKLNIRKPKLARDVAITDPIEKLDGTWIAEDNVRKNDDGPPEVHGDCAGNTLLIRNLSLLKPAQWTEYLPITESVPSLYLSVYSDSDQAPQKWYRRLAKFFLCCK